MRKRSYSMTLLVLLLTLSRTWAQGGASNSDPMDVAQQWLSAFIQSDTSVLARYTCAPDGQEVGGTGLLLGMFPTIASNPLALDADSRVDFTGLTFEVVTQDREWAEVSYSGIMRIVKGDALNDIPLTSRLHLRAENALWQVCEATYRHLNTSTSATDSADFDFLAHNADWTPYGQAFDGVPMMLVPAGCFTMGNDEYAAGWNRFGDYVVGAVTDGGQQCFALPFWIDQTEVTQADFVRLGGQKAKTNAFSGDNLPVERITWFEARDFCALRGERLNAEVRLPTEAEWEYAARGVENWFFPWGNEWDTHLTVWNALQTAEVGSIPASASWAGTFNMSGNVREWTRSIHAPYPYDRTDGREANRGDNREVRYVFRGGSWFDAHPFNVRSATRPNSLPFSWESYVGFRCILAYD